MKHIAIDIETVGLRPYEGTIWMLSVTQDKKSIVLHDCNGKVHYFKEYKRILEDPKVCKIIHNAGFDAAYIELNTGIKIRNIWDTQLVEVVIQGTQIPFKKPEAWSEERYEALKIKHGSALSYVLPRYGFKKPDKSVRENFINRAKGIPFTKQEIQYAVGDTRDLDAIRQAQEYLLQRDGGMEVALLENKVAEVVANMAVNGLGVDVGLWNKIADDNLAIYNKLKKQLPSTVDNWNSPKQVKDFFNNRGVPLNSFKELEPLYAQTKDPILGRFIKLRELYSDTTAYGKKWLYNDDGELWINNDGRLRTNWQQIVNTGRFSTSNPNILALPKEGSQRAAIVPRKGYSFIIGDYSGQELGIIAAAAKEDMWIEALLRGESIHSLTASIMFPTEWAQSKERGCTFPFKCKCKGHQDVTGLPYFNAKKQNFMLAYGGGVNKFMEISGYDKSTARRLVYKHKRSIPKIDRYLSRNGQLAIKTGVAYSADPYKRRIILRGQEEWQIKNQGKNYPIQSAGANMLKLAMISMPEQYPVVLPFHDELVLEVPIKEAKKAAVVMQDVMEQSSAYITGIKGLIKVKPRIAQNFSKF